MKLCYIFKGVWCGAVFFFFFFLQQRPLVAVSDIKTETTIDYLIKGNLIRLL